MSIVVLLVEDNLGDVRLTPKAFQKAKEDIQLHVACDGIEPMKFLRHQGASANAPRPDFILLDLNIRKMDGCEVLAQIKRDESLKSIPTLIRMTSQVEADITKSCQLHANCCLCKPVELHGFESLGRGIAGFWLAKAKLPQLWQVM